MINAEQLQLALGTKRNWASEELLEMLNSIEMEGADLIRENWLTHSLVLREGVCTMEAYTTAVKYVSLKQMGHTNQEAYSIALADRYQRMVADGMDNNKMSSNISAYHKGQLVQKILAQSTIPLWMLYQDEQHKAIGVLVRLMTDPNVSYQVQSDSADKLLSHIKRPETAKVELDITTRQADGMGELQAMLRELAERQLKALHNGADVHVVANLPMLEAQKERS